MATLLIIEDEVVLARNMGRFLERQGHDVHVANDGHQGMDVFFNVQPDLVVLDYQLPGLDGVEIVRRIHAENPSLPVVMVTGHGTVSLAVEAIKSGAMDVLTKPITLEALRALVERALEQRQQRNVLAYYREREVASTGSQTLLGDSPAMVQLREMIQLFARQEPADRSPPGR